MPYATSEIVNQNRAIQLQTNRLEDGTRKPTLPYQIIGASSKPRWLFVHIANLTNLTRQRIRRQMCRRWQRNSSHESKRQETVLKSGMIDCLYSTMLIHRWKLQWRPAEARIYEWKFEQREAFAILVATLPPLFSYDSYLVSALDCFLLLW